MIKASGELVHDLQAFYGENSESSLLSQYIPTLLEMEKFQQEKVMPMVKTLASKLGQSTKVYNKTFEYFEVRFILVHL